MGLSRLSQDGEEETAQMKSNKPKPQLELGGLEVKLYVEAYPSS